MPRTAFDADLKSSMAMTAKAGSLVGLLAGALSGYFLQLLVLTVVTGSGSLNEPRNLDIFVIEGLTGMVVGGIAMAAVGMLRRGRKTPNT